MTTLIIVESPGKISSIRSYVGSGYVVKASIGHVRDLPPKDIGIDRATYQMTYFATERGRRILAELKQAVAAADNVILATDDDREGEAISWHLADALKLKDPARAKFTSITKEKVVEGVRNPGRIDRSLVRAQEARRALDRIVGWEVSPVLSDRAGQNLSAGRVQSVAVRLVVDLEREISAFQSTQHYGAELSFKINDETSWKAQWDTKPHIKDGETYMLDQTLAERVAAVRDVSVKGFEDTKKARAPGSPFTTSTMQQAAGHRLKMGVKKAMDAAQRLYELGAITYHRTDSPNIDPAGVANIIDYAAGAGLPLAPKPRTWQAKEGAQQGHEAIRPTNAAVLEAGEDDAQRALYRLIWQRAVASQLADAIYAVRTATLAGTAPATGAADSLPVTFIAKGKTLISDGWLSVYGDNEDEAEAKGKDKGDATESNNPIPTLAQGDALTASAGRVLSKQTKPPARYKEPTLVAELERKGIGRPSTYAAIVENIKGRGYVSVDKSGFMRPEKLGETVRDALVGRFSFMEYDYTRSVEEDFDKIASGKADFAAVVSSCWESIEAELAALKSLNIAPAHPCPECGKAMRRRPGKHGFFWSCSGYPACTVTAPDAKGKPGERKTPPAPTGIDCPKCGKELARRQGMTKAKKVGGVLVKPKPYDFYSCTGYPKCDATYKTGADGKPILTQAG